MGAIHRSSCFLKHKLSFESVCSPHAMIGLLACLLLFNDCKFRSRILYVDHGYSFAYLEAAYKSNLQQLISCKLMLDPSGC